MLKVISCFILFVLSFSAQAVFQEIWKGYQNSKLNKSNLLNSKINEENYKYELNKFDWQLFFTPIYSHVFEDALFDFQAQETITTGVTFGLQKTSYKYGTFSIQQEQRQLDLSNWSASQLSRLDDDQLYETTNTLAYSYDFLDKSTDTDYDLAKIDSELKSLEANHSVEQGHFDFFTVYIQAKRQVYAVRLTKESINEAKKRVNQISRRVKDGLSRKVELLQAKSNLLIQKETLEKNRSALKQNLAIIENLIGMPINDQYLDKLTWKKFKFAHWKQFIKESESRNVEILKKQLLFSEKSLEKMAEANGHKLALNASYAINDIDATQSTSFSNATNGRRFNQQLSLTWTIPLGGDKRDGLINKTAYQKKKNELDLLNIQDEMKVKKKALLEQIAYHETAIDFAKQKVTVAKETLRQQNKLYLRGQASFEEVIRSEEAYINARLSEKTLLADYELLIGNFAFLNNSTLSLLRAYED